MISGLYWLTQNHSFIDINIGFTFTSKVWALHVIESISTHKWGIQHILGIHLFIRHTLLPYTGQDVSIFLESPRYSITMCADYMLKVILLAHMGITLIGVCETLGIMSFSLNRWQHLMVGFGDQGPIYPKGGYSQASKCKKSAKKKLF